METLDVVIVNWNTGKYLEDCIKSILNQNINLIGNIIIVDNNSDDNSANNLQYLSPKIKIIFEKKNNGFARGCNIGSKFSKNKYLLFLNPDCQILENTLENVVKFITKNENQNIGICGTKMVDNLGRTVASVSRFPTLKNLLFKISGFDFLFKKQGMLMRDFDHEKSGYVDQIIGAFFLIKRELFLKLDGFDEDFFLYMDEVDLSLRVKKLGYKSYYYADGKCFHEGGVSSKKNMVQRNINVLKSRIIYARKHFSKTDILVLIFASVFFEPLFRVMFYIFKLSPSNIKITIASYLYFIKWLIK